MEPYQQRVVDEKAALDEKLSALLAFQEGDSFLGLDKDEQLLLKAQSGCMKAYANVLAARIAKF